MYWTLLIHLSIIDYMIAQMGNAHNWSITLNWGQVQCLYIHYNKVDVFLNLLKFTINTPSNSTSGDFVILLPISSPFFHFILL